MTPHPEPFPLLEPLEDRIAPASAFYTDVDGDSVKVTTSKGTDTDLQAIVDTGNNMGQMENFNLTSLFAGSTVKFAVTARGATGDGLVNVWHINADNMDLSSVEVAGDLGKLTVGDANYGNGSVKSVKVQSIGVNGGAPSTNWLMKGSTSSFNVAGDVLAAKLEWSNTDGQGKLTVGSIVIGGNLTGGTAAQTGSVILNTGMNGTAELKSISIGGSIVATDYNSSGSILVGDLDPNQFVVGKLGKVTIGGSLLGDNNKTYSGAIYSSSTIESVTVGGSLVGGGDYSGSIVAYSKMTGDVKVGGSLQGGAGLYSGSIFSFNGTGKSISIGGGLFGANGAYSGSVASTLGNVGNVTTGSYLSGGNGFYSGSIYGKTGLGNVSVGGSVFGSSGQNSGFIGTDGASGQNAGDITVLGDLSGGSDFSTGVISANSAGKISITGSILGGSEQGAGGIYLTGGAKSVSIGGNVEGTDKASAGTVKILGATAKLSSFTVGGSLLGDMGASGGSITVNGSVDKFVIGGGLGGGDGTGSGSLTFGTIKSLTVGTGANVVASIYGGGGSNAGSIIGTTLGTASLSGNIQGGGAAGAGKIDVVTAKDITVGGNLLGGSADTTGAILVGSGGLTGKLTVNGNVSQSVFDNVSNSALIQVGGSGAKAIEIKGNLVGGSASMAAIKNSGAVVVTGMLKSLTIGGDITAGEYFDNTNVNLGAIRAGFIDTMVVKGGLQGASSDSPVVITAQGNTAKTSGTNIALKALTIEGSVNNARILGGYDTIGTTKDGNGGANGGGAQMGTITILGDFLDSSIATGVDNNTNSFANWANGMNTLLSTNPIVASIAKIVIQGSCFAASQNGVAAEKISSLSVGGFLVPIAAGAQNPTINGNFKAQQVVA